MDRNNNYRKSRFAFVLVSFLVMQFTYADSTALEQPIGYVEAGANYHHLTNDFDNWNGIYAKGVWQGYSDQVWNWEVLRQSEFDDHGTYFTGGLSHTFDEDWFATASAGASSGGFFFPKHRFDITINRKLLPDRNLVATFGAGYITARDIHRDRIILLSAAYYFGTPWVIEGGVRLNHSTPGSINANNYFIAVTQGQDKKRYLTLLIESGREAYQVIDESSTLVDFHSDLISLTWREWLQRDWGLNATIEHYNNPFYNRNGVILGVFREF